MHHRMTFGVKNIGIGLDVFFPNFRGNEVDRYPVFRLARENLFIIQLPSKTVYSTQYYLIGH